MGPLMLVVLVVQWLLRTECLQEAAEKVSHSVDIFLKRDVIQSVTFSDPHIFHVYQDCSSGAERVPLCQVVQPRLELAEIYSSRAKVHEYILAVDDIIISLVQDKRLSISI